MTIETTELEEAFLWLARSGGSLTFASVGMACAAPAHANAGYAVRAAVPGERGPESASAFAGSYEARTLRLTPDVARVVAELRARTASAQSAVLAPRPAASGRPGAAARAAA